VPIDFRLLGKILSSKKKALDFAFLEQIGLGWFFEKELKSFAGHVTTRH